jgi:hypothetical protein
LKSFSLATLKKLDAAITASTPLPFGLDAYRAEVVSFLDDAIVGAQLLQQLGLIAAVPVQG